MIQLWSLTKYPFSCNTSNYLQLLESVEKNWNFSRINEVKDEKTSLWFLRWSTHIHRLIRSRRLWLSLFFFYSIFSLSLSSYVFLIVILFSCFYSHELTSMRTYIIVSNFAIGSSNQAVYTTFRFLPRLRKPD